MANNIPSLGARGVYRLAEPFDTLPLTNAMYTTKAVRRLRDFLVLGQDPREEFYTRHGLDETVWLRDSRDERVCIVSLVSDTGHWLYVPSSFILAYPDLNGVPYSVRALGINLGALPEGMDLSNLYLRVEALVRDTIGVDAKASSLVISETTMMSQAESRVLEQARLDRVETSQTDRAQHLADQRIIAAQRDKIAELEAYIVAQSQ